MTLKPLVLCRFTILLGLLLVPTDHIWAQDGGADDRRIELAQDAVLEGRDLFRKGKYQASIIAYERAYRFFPQPEQLFVIAVAYEKLEGRCADALLGWSRFFEACSNCERRAEGIARAKHLLRSCSDADQVTGLDFLKGRDSSSGDDYGSAKKRRRRAHPTREFVEESDDGEDDGDAVDRCRRSRKAWAVFSETCIECETDARGERIKNQIRTYCRGRAGDMELISRNS